MKELTIREKSAIAYALIFEDASPSDLLRLSRDCPISETDKLKHLPSSATHFWQSERIQSYLNERKAILAARDERIRQEGRDEALKGMEKRPESEAYNIDYNSPRARRQLYNDIIAQSKGDPKTQLDAAKMFETLQKENRAIEPDEHYKVYLPLTCHKCPLYRRAKENLIKDK